MRTYIYIVIIILSNSNLDSYANFKDFGTIEGRVYNVKNNQPIEFAAVALWGSNNGTLSNENGRFVLNDVKPGYVELRVSIVGFEPYVSEQFMVTKATKVFIEIPLQETSILLEEVVVKASPFKRTLESPVSLRNIGIQEIEKNPGGNRDISRVIQSLPGVASAVTYRNDVIVRGGGSSENRFYLDGVEIPNLNHFATQGASGGPVGIINVDFIREVNFYSSAFPANMGNATSSVFDFKQVDGNRDKLKVRAAVGASDMALTLDGPLTDSTTFIFSVRRSYLQFLFSVIGLPFLPTYNDFQFKTRTFIDSKSEISFIGIGAIDQFKLNLEANETEEQRYILRYLPINNQWNYTLGAVYRRYHENCYDTWVLSRNMLHNSQYKYLNNIETAGNKILDYQSFEAENKLRYERNTQFGSGYKLIAGAGMEYARYFNSTFRRFFGGTEEYTTNTDFVKWSVFSQLSRSFFSKKLGISAGLRADGINYSPQMANPLNQLSPRFSASYALLPYLNINASTGRFFQLPAYTTMGYRNNAGVLVNKENNLRYISSNHYVGGFDIVPDQKSKFSLEGFLKHYGNYPFSVADSVAIASKGADYGTFGDEEVLSNGKGRAYGMELLYQNKDIMGLNLTISYTLVRSEFIDIAGKYIPSAWDNKHIFNLLLRKDFSTNWDIGIKWRFVGGSPYTPANLEKSALVEAWDVRGQTYPDYSRYNSQRLGAFHQLNLRVDKEFFFDKWSLISYIDIQNIYNFKADAPPVFLKDETAPIIPNPDRYTLKELPRTSGGTILPTIGIIVMF